MDRYKGGEIKGVFTVYPNPGSDFIKVRLSESIKNENEVSVRIISSKSQLVYHIENINAAKETNDFSVPIQQLVPGIYFILIQTDTELQSMKFIKL